MNIVKYSIIFITALVCIIPSLDAQEAGLRVLVQSSPDIPVAGSPWVLTLLINHTVPEEVTVMPPSFTGTFFLELLLKGPRLVNPATGQNYIEKKQQAGTEPEGAEIAPEQAMFEHWTAMEYRFMLNNSGEAELDAFTVITPQGRLETDPLHIRVQPAPTGIVQLYPRLSWEGLPTAIRQGGTAEFSLRIQDWNSQLPLPPQDFFLPNVAPGLILESRAIGASARAAGTVLVLRLLPLNAEPFSLPRRTLTYGNAVFEIPSLRINVSPAAPLAAPNAVTPNSTAPNGASVEPEAENLAEQPESSGFPFPAFDVTARLFEPAADGGSSPVGKYRTDCERIYHTAQSLWQTDQRAEALAFLREQERDHPAGPVFALVRKEAEQRLGLYRTGDEQRQKFPFPVFTLALFCALAAAVCRLRFSDMRTGKKQLVLRVIAPLFCGGLACLFTLYGFIRPGNSRSFSGVVKETALRRIPDSSGEETARLTEGQPVLLPSTQFDAGQGTWVRLTTNDDNGISGWVPKEVLIFY